ncbi:MAG: glycine zipper domain-containing protein [Gemmatimonadota bacterium]
MNRTRLISSILLLLGLAAAPAGLSAQRDQSRVAATVIGAGLGVASGGYMALSIVVAEARAGRYVHDVGDVLGWRSMPVIAGAATGAALGAYSPRRLEAAALYGTGGLAGGALLGMAVGAMVWDPPEGRWAGAAIGAGVGLLIGNVLGIFYPYRASAEEAEADAESQSAGIPVMVRIPL